MFCLMSLRYSNIFRTGQLLWQRNGVTAFYRGQIYNVLFGDIPSLVYIYSIIYIYVCTLHFLFTHGSTKLDNYKTCPIGTCAGILPQMMRTVPQSMAFFSIYEYALTALRFLGTKS